LAFEDSRKEVTLSISPISPASLLNSSLATALATSAQQTSSASTTTPASSLLTNPSSNPADVLTQDVVNLLKALASGDVSGAKTDLAKFKTDLKAQQATTTSSNLVQDTTSLLKDLSSGNASAAKTDVTNVQADLQAEDASGASSKTSSTQTVSPLDTLVDKISDSLSSVSVSGALQDLASYLVQNGQGSGTLINIAA